MLIVLGGYFGLLGWAERPGDLQDPIRYEVSTGQSFAEIAQQLQQHQAISNTTLFSIYARLHALMAFYKRENMRFRGMSHPRRY